LPELKISASGKVELKVTTEAETTRPVAEANPPASAPYWLTMIHPEIHEANPEESPLLGKVVVANNGKLALANFAMDFRSDLLADTYTDPCKEKYRAYLDLYGRCECEPRILQVYPLGLGGWERLNGNRKGFGLLEQQLNYKF